MRRRQFIGFIATAVLPTMARAQQPLPVIGFLHAGSSANYVPQIAGLHQGLRESGYVEGQNIALEYRWANGRVEDLPPLAMDLVKRQVSVIVTSGNRPAQAAKAATTTIPIIFNVTDPVRLGLVNSLPRPGGNATGINVVAGELGPKRLGLLRELVPFAKSIAFLVNPGSSLSGFQISQMEEAARALGMSLQSFNATAEGDFDAAFSGMVQRRADLLVVAADPIFNNLRDELVVLAARHAIPAIYEWREFVVAGGLMSYGSSLNDAFRQMGLYAGQVLRGVKPADLPVIQPTRFEFVINLKTAKALGLVVPNSMQLLADEIVE